MDLPFRPPKRSRRSPQYETSELITAERPVGSKRRLRSATLPVRIRESLLFLVSCYSTAAIVGLIVYLIETTGLPSDADTVSLWQLFDAGVQRFAITVFGMWLCHLATTLIAGRIRRVRASEGAKISAIAGLIAYPLFVASAWLVSTMQRDSRAVNLILAVTTVFVPGVVATLLAQWKTAPQ